MPQPASTTPATYVPVFSNPPQSFRLPWKSALVIALYGVSLLLLNLAGKRVLTYHEVLFAEPAKEMLATGDFLVPRFAGVPSTHKPPGTHWSIALMMAITGTDEESWIRVPSALAGVVTALLVASMGARWFGARVGLIAGLMQLTTYYVLQLARLAECDMLLIAALTGAMYAFAAANVDSPRGRTPARRVAWLFYLCVALAYFFKGLIGISFIFSGCVLFLLVNQDLKGLKFFWSPTGLFICAASVLGWFVAACVQYPPFLDDQIAHHFGRFQGEMGGSKDPLFYLYSVLLITLPWAPLMIYGLVRGVRLGLYAEPFWRFAACWALPGMVLLNLSVFKSKHYAAPLAPPLTIIGACALVHYLQQRHRFAGWRQAVAAVASVAGCAVAAAVVWKAQPRGAQAVVALIGVLAAGLLAVIYFEYKRRLAAQLAAIFSLCWLISFGALNFVIPHHDSYRDQTELAQRINEITPANAPLYMLDLPENQIAYYLQAPLVRHDNPSKFLSAPPRDQRELFVLAPEYLTKELKQIGKVEPLDRCASINRYLTPKQRLTLVKVSLEPDHVADRPTTRR